MNDRRYEDIPAAMAGRIAYNVRMIVPNGIEPQKCCDEEEGRTSSRNRQIIMSLQAGEVGVVGAKSRWHSLIEFWGEIVAEYQVGELAFRSLAGKLIPDFAIHTYGAKFLREFERQDEPLSGKCDPARRLATHQTTSPLGSRGNTRSRFQASITCDASQSIVGNGGVAARRVPAPFLWLSRAPFGRSALPRTPFGKVYLLAFLLIRATPASLESGAAGTSCRN